MAGAVADSDPAAAFGVRPFTLTGPFSFSIFDLFFFGPGNARFA
jgi:hypothetical protein